MANKENTLNKLPLNLKNEQNMDPKTLTFPIPKRSRLKIFQEISLNLDSKSNTPIPNDFPPILSPAHNSHESDLLNDLPVEINKTKITIPCGLIRQTTRNLEIKNIPSDLHFSQIQHFFTKFGDLKTLDIQQIAQNLIIVSFFDIRDSYLAYITLRKFINCGKINLEVNMLTDTKEYFNENRDFIVVEPPPGFVFDFVSHVFQKFGDILGYASCPENSMLLFIKYFDIRHAQKAAKALITTKNSFKYESKVDVRNLKYKNEEPDSLVKNISAKPFVPRRRMTDVITYFETYNRKPSVIGENPEDKNQEPGSGNSIESTRTDPPGVEEVVNNKEARMKGCNIGEKNCFGQYGWGLAEMRQNWPRMRVTRKELESSPSPYPGQKVFGEIIRGNSPGEEYNLEIDNVHQFQGIRRRNTREEELQQYTINITDVEAGDDRRTTLMIKNIPNKYTQRLLLDTIDKYHADTYDFFYIPIDFRNKCNVGYAFINFKGLRELCTFYSNFNGKKWEKFNSEKICTLTYARVQGRERLVTHFKSSSIMKQGDHRLKPILLH